MFFRIIARQIWHKRCVALLLLLAMTALVALQGVVDKCLPGRFNEGYKITNW
jgi:hypothetical protein